ncbi:hypothetical protein ACIBVL_10610 [Streptomyces sp. NPDC049687]|uniref:hypothetical protein n=1 Tax=Streptomyces sp. NPDC049687 TaxID=3365596 RepID=UPI0037AA4661
MPPRRMLGGTGKHVALDRKIIGGELVVEHAGQECAYRASETDLTLVAFYADCRHQVTPVRSGYRVTLTFNLLAEPGTWAEVSGPLAELAHSLGRHFGSPAKPRYGTRELDPPTRLVYLLDHEYTQRGLSWERLKGADAERAALLRAAAGQAGCESVLALAEVKETWDACPEGADPWGDYGYDENEDGDAGEDGGYVLQELVDDEITLGWWTGPDGPGGEEISLRVQDYEVCASTASADLTPYDSQYEGYRGNYGNTLDRWYRRAAVVVPDAAAATRRGGEHGGRVGRGGARAGLRGPAASCAVFSVRSSAPGRGGSTNGRWRRRGSGMCTPGSTRPSCRCATRPGGRGARTRWY